MQGKLAPDMPFTVNHTRVIREGSITATGTGNTDQPAEVMIMVFPETRAKTRIPGMMITGILATGTTT